MAAYEATGESNISLADYKATDKVRRDKLASEWRKLRAEHPQLAQIVWKKSRKLKAACERMLLDNCMSSSEHGLATLFKEEK